MPATAIDVMSDDSEAAWEECFICAQEAPPSSLVHGVCACRERYMHVACQRQMLEQSAFSDSCQAATCPVCRSVYTNSRLEYTQAPLSPPPSPLALTTLALTAAPCRCPHQSLSAEGKLCVVLVLCNLLLVLCAMVELRAWAFGHGHCGVCLQLGLALLVEAAIGGTTIAWVSMSTTLHMQTHRARIYSHIHPIAALRRRRRTRTRTLLISSGARVAAGARRPHRPTAAELRGRYLVALKTARDARGGLPAIQAVCWSSVSRSTLDQVHCSALHNPVVGRNKV